jgi:hypothetical protein
MSRQLGLIRIDQVRDTLPSEALVVLGFSRRQHANVHEVPPWQATARTRVLIEHPDRSVLWGYRTALVDGGYEVATCTGPGSDDVDVVRCPLLEDGSCPLVEGADIVLSTCSLARSDEILDRLLAAGTAEIVFELPEPTKPRYRTFDGLVSFLTDPVTETSLMSAVGRSAARSRLRSQAPPGSGHERVPPRCGRRAGDRAS